MSSMQDQYQATVRQIRDLGRDVEASLDHLHWRSRVKTDSRVFVKPNFTFPYHREGITTSPKLIRIVLEALKDRAEEVYVGESDGGNRSFTADEGFKGHDMYEICRESGVNLVNLSKEESKTYEDRIQGKVVRVGLPRLLTEKVDCFVSLPVLKVHVMTGVSLGIKNLWGCYPDTMRCLNHKDLDRKLALLTKLLKPSIVLIDGMSALDIHGPMHGTVRNTNLLIGSDNAVVSDTLGSAIMGISLTQARHILTCESEGLGTTDLGRVNIDGDWQEYRQRFRIQRTLIDRASVLLFNNEIIPRIVMDSALTPFIYKIAGALRNKDEKELAADLRGYCR